MDAHPTRQPQTPAKRILIRLPNPIGDVVAATPLIQALQQLWPQSEFVLAGGRGAQQLLAGFPHIQDYLAIRSKSGSSWRRVTQASRDLSPKQLDLSILLPNSWSSALESLMAGIPEIWGRRAQGRGWLLHRAIPPIRKPGPMTEIYLDLARAMGWKATQAPPLRLFLTEHERQASAERLKAWPQKTRWLAVAPGAGFGPSKLYPPYSLAKALQQIRSRWNLIPILLGAPAEVGLLNEVARLIGPPYVNTNLHPAGLGELKALLSKSEALLCMDAGSRHIAAALQVPQVVIYGPTDPAWSSFQTERTVIVRKSGLDCSPCHLRHCPIAHPCMEEIAPEEIADAFGQLITTRSQKPATSQLRHATKKTSDPNAYAAEQDSET